MRIILLGPPGSGKGTQGNLIEKKYGLPKISTGDLLRSEVREGTQLGREAEARMNRGELVDDDIVVGMIQNRISKPEYQRGYIMDGFPRNIVQAQRLEEIDPERKEIAIEIYLSDQAIFDRLSARRTCPVCETIYNLKNKPPKKEPICDACGEKLILRDDDKPEVIKDRMKVYHEQTEILIDYYSKKKVYFKIEGEGTVETVFDNISSLLDRELAKSQEVGITK
ncbi:MAG: adenylate kinase [Candidatus Aminicenantes bacterium]|jgi:adenylate kinase